jgi:hypothetical protein
MMLIDLTAQLGSLLVGLDVILVFSATAIAVSTWHRQSASLNRGATKFTVVGTSSRGPTPKGDAPGDTSIPEAA